MEPASVNGEKDKRNCALNRATSKQKSPRGLHRNPMPLIFRGELESRNGEILDMA